jgi:hypothetical protein
LTSVEDSKLDTDVTEEFINYLVEISKRPLTIYYGERALSTFKDGHKQGWSQRVYVGRGIRGGMNSKGAHELSPKKGFPLIFCLQNSNENEVPVNGIRNRNH